MNPFIEDLRKRGILQDMTPGLEDQLNKEMTSGYIGFDPTSDSLHIGNLAQIILLKRFQQFGHRPNILIGTATASIGDPAGKANERQLMDKEAITKNSHAILSQVWNFFSKKEAENNLTIISNDQWMDGYSFLDFIRDVGKHFNINTMLAKDSVKTRLANGLSFTEFSYQLLQAHDFYWMCESSNIRLQMGGSDQWGNITAGIDFVHKKAGKQTFGLVIPLVTKTDGSKFGKTESGNIWLDRRKTSPYQFYQYWLNLSDDDAIKMFPIFSMMDIDDIIIAIEKHKQIPSSRLLQKWLADEMTELVHSKKDLEQSKESSEILFGKGTVEALKGLSEHRLIDVLQGLPHAASVKEIFKGEVNIITFLYEAGIFPSKGEARKMIANNGVSINKEKVTDKFLIREEMLLHGKYLLVQKGKQNSLVIFS